MKILKLGGSVLTIKNKPFTPNKNQIERLMDEIATAYPTPLILIHGGGSFGHPLAKEYNLTQGFSTSRQIFGFARTHQAMVALNTIIIDALLNAGVPALSMSPSTFIRTNKDRIDKIDLSLVGQLVIKGILPVLHGDVVLDKTKGFSILSGDQLAVQMGKSLGASKIIFGVDVDGVFTSNPKLTTDAKLIEHLPLDKLEGFIKIGEALTTDVTGGMLGKVSEAKIAVKAGVEVLIVNATKPDVILKGIRGEPVTGTLLTR